MKKNCFVVDTSSNIKNGQYEDVFVLPINVIEVTKNGDIEHKDGIDITPSELEQKQLDGINFKTAATSPSDALELLDKVTKEYETVYVLPIPKTLSEGAHNMFNTILPEYTNVKLFRQDTVSVFSIMQMEDILAVNKKNGGFITEEQINEITKYYHDHLGAALIVPDLSFLVKGGRINRAKGAIAKLFKITALCSFDNEGVSFRDKVINLNKLPTLAMKYYKNQCGLKEDLSNVVKVGIICPSVHNPKYKINEIKNLFDEKFLSKIDIQPVVGPLPSAISAHVGPNFIAIGFVTK